MISDDRLRLRTLCLCLVLLDAALPARGAQDWSFYGGDAGGRRYSAHSEITPANVRSLRVAWHVHTGELDREPPPPRHRAFEATPILADGLLYLPTPSGEVLALDPGSGEERWRFSALVRGHEYPEYASRGVAFWRDRNAVADGHCATRIFGVTIASQLYALDARSGGSCRQFGEDGSIDLRRGVGELGPWDYAHSSPPVLAGDVLIVGSAIGDNGRAAAPRGTVRAFDARTGSPRWSWDPMEAAAANRGHTGKGADAQFVSGAANAWAPLSVDEARGMVFIPTGSASPDYYGGLRSGDNRHANSVVALRADSGELAWSYQLVHHDLWDYDVPAQPTLATLDIGGRKRDVLIQTSKMGMLFVLDRDSGLPVFPVDERPVPVSDVPGERASPTQPFPRLPPPLVPHSLRVEDAWGLTPLDRRSCRRKLAALRNEGIYTPPSLRGTLSYPGIGGGSNWGGVAVDHDRGIVVANVSNAAYRVRLIPREQFQAERERNDSPFREYAAQAGTPYGMVREPLLSPLMLPCNPPPWGTLNAVSLADGRLLWSVPLGTVPDRIPFPVPIDFGLPSLGGPLVTAGGLVFIAASMDSYMRAFDLGTGNELWKQRLPAGGNASPMSYMFDGRQYIVIAAGGHGKIGTRAGDSVLAWTLAD